ncbi:hypothetical protein CJJ07_001454 [Candidozyma auris]|nr:hypothetical protein CJJ07_001454 [[Candida] auris]QEL62501.1 hypothetical protein CJJ09_004678 [[Candida] auris]
MFSFARRLVDRLDGSNLSHHQSDDAYFKETLKINNNGFGLRVLKVIPHSRAHKLGLEAWFDYIVRINTNELPMKYPQQSGYGIKDDGALNYGSVSPEVGVIDWDVLAQELENIAHNNGPRTVEFDVWSAKGGVIRQIRIPLDEFHSELRADTGADEKAYLNNFQQIGLTVQSEHLKNATYVWRILNTHPNSPAFEAKLVPQSDYIIGCDSCFESDGNGKGLLSNGGERLLSQTILSYYNHHSALQQKDKIPIQLYVYNHDYDVLRPVTVHLSREWSKGTVKGILGCDVGYGWLHRIPGVVGKFDNMEPIDDLIFENDADYSYKLQQESTEQQHPRSLSQQSTEPKGPPPSLPTAQPLGPPSAPAPPKSARKKKHTNPSANIDLTSFMNEELDKSKASDVQFGEVAEATPPPPPPSKVSRS